MLSGLRATLRLLPAFLLATPLPAAEDAPDNATASLPPVTVTATRQTAPLEDVPAAVSVVGKDAIQRGTQRIAIDEALRTVPGVFVLNRYNFAQDTRIAVRGFGARADFGIRGIRLIVDGIPATTPDGQGGVDGIDFASAESVEVIRGPAAALYGAASGGVIRIETEEGPQVPFAETRITAGSDGFFKTGFKTGGANGPFNYLVSGTRLRFDGYRANNRTENTKFNAKLNFRPSAQTEVTAIANTVDIPVQDDPGGLTRTEARADPAAARARNLRFDAGERVAQEKLGLTLRHRFAENRELRLRSYVVRRDFANKLPFEDGGQVAFDRRFAGGGALFRLGDDAASLTAGIDVGWQEDARKNFDNLDGLRGPLALDQEETVLATGVFLRQEVRLPADLKLSAALRHDRVRFHVDDRFRSDGDDSGTLTFSETSPMAGIRWNPRPGLNLYANVATAFETPTTTEFDNPDGGGFNEALRPQTATSFEIGAKGRLPDAPWPLRYDIAAFTMDIADSLVPFEKESSPGREFFRNAGSATRHGLETALTVRPAEPLRVRFTHTWSDFRYDRFRPPGGNFGGNTIPGIPRHFGNIELAYESDSGLFAVWNTRIVGPLYADDANRTRVDGHTVSDLRFGFEHRSGNWTVAPFAGVNNLFDTDYNANIRINAFGGRHFEPAPERAFYAGIRVRYTFD